MLHVIALAIARFIRFAFENLTEKFICLVLEESRFVGNPAEQAIRHQLPARAGLIRESPQLTIEIDHASGGLYALIGSCGL